VRDHLSPPSIAVRLKPLSNNDSGCHSGKLSNDKRRHARRDDARERVR
jgi:hypothetical protein